MCDNHSFRRLLLLFFAAVVAGTSEADAHFTTIRIAGAKTLWATGINNAGAVTGYFWQCAAQSAKWPKCSEPNEYSFIRAPDGTMSIIASGYQANAINDNGDIAGAYGLLGFLRTADGTITTFQYSYRNTWATAINANDTVVGNMCNTCDGDSVAFLRMSDGTTTILDPPGGSTLDWASGINASGVAVGWFEDDQGDDHGFTYSPNRTYVTFDVPGTTWTHPSSINSNGDTAGSYITTAGTYCFVRYADGSFWTITSLDNCFVSGINDLDEIAGTSNDVGFEMTSSKTKMFHHGSGLNVASGPNSSKAVAGYFWEPNKKGTKQLERGFIWQP